MKQTIRITESELRDMVKESVKAALSESTGFSPAIEQAIQYVRDNKTWSDAEEQAALDNINHMRCGISDASEEISMAVYDLMEEFGEQNGYPENWWLEETDEDEIFFEL